MYYRIEEIEFARRLLKERTSTYLKDEIVKIRDNAIEELIQILKTEMG